MPTVLLTGFEPFDRAERNSSADAVAEVARTWSREEQLVTATLPVEFGRASEVLAALIAEHSPDLVIAAGLADGRTAITPELVAINLENARIPDNAGAQPRGRAIDPDGPAARFSALPVREIVDAIATQSIPARVSLSAGAFVCNSLMYRLMAGVPEGTMAGFVHVPSERDLSIHDIARGLTTAVAVSLER